MHLAVLGGGGWFAGALNALLSQETSLHPVHITDDPSDFVQACSRTPQIAILASDITRENLRKRVTCWRNQYPSLRIVVRLRTLRPDLVRDAIQAGAWGCFAEDDPPETLLNLLKSVASGRVSFPFVDFSTLSDDPFEQLTRREQEVLSALSKGWTNGQISARLGVSENTVKYHLKLIYEKLGVRNRSTAVAKYFSYSVS